MPHSHEHEHDHAPGSGHAHRVAARRIPASPLGTGIGTRLAIAGLAAGLLWLTVFWAMH